MIGMLGRWIETLLAGGPQTYRGVMGIFLYVDDATAAVKALRQSGLGPLSIFSPVPHHDLERAMEQGPSLVRWVTLAGAVTGLTGGFALCIYSVISWPLVVGGKELISLPPFVTIGYECTILLAGISNLLGMLALCRLPELQAPAPYDPRFTEDRIGVWVPCVDEDVERAHETLRGHGAEEVNVYD